jgi:hypothetical protein
MMTQLKAFKSLHMPHHPSPPHSTHFRQSTILPRLLWSVWFDKARSRQRSLSRHDSHCVDLSLADRTYVPYKASGSNAGLISPHTHLLLLLNNLHWSAYGHGWTSTHSVQGKHHHCIATPETTSHALPIHHTTCLTKPPVTMRQGLQS